MHGLRYCLSANRRFVKCTHYTSPPSCSDPGPFVGVSRDVFHSRLKGFLYSKSVFLHSYLSIPRANVPEFYHTLFLQSTSGVILAIAAH